MPRSSLAPVLLMGEQGFPDPNDYDSEGLVGIGGDLSIERLSTAYRSGIFPWYSEGMPPLWWSPDPRGVITEESLHISRSLRRLLKNSPFTISWNQAFLAVMIACGERRGGTWILPEMRDAYLALHQAGLAHSLEVWQGGELVGGLYGVQCGALFAAESMFHRVTDASKVALAHTVARLSKAGVALFDVQFVTPHLARCGAYNIPRKQYLQRVAQLRDVGLNLVSIPETSEHLV